LGETLTDRLAVLGVRFASVKWALAALGEMPSFEEVVRVVYALSRQMDHLADPTLLLTICRETGWNSEGRLRALIGADD
jgi:hypothetical protein